MFVEEMKICLILISRGQPALQSQGFLYVIMNSTPQPICTHDITYYIKLLIYNIILDRIYIFT